MPFQKYYDKDNLISTSFLEVVEHPAMGTLIYVKGNAPIQVFLLPDLDSVFKFIYEEKNLWNNASFYVINRKISKLRAPIYGVPFVKALKVVLKEGLIKSRFYFPNYDKLKYEAVIADLIIHLGFNRKEKKKEVQLWQSLDKDNKVFYIHFIIDNYLNAVEHLDGAIIHFTDEQKNILFEKGKKVKGDSYQKLFRINSIISIEKSIEIIRKYFPIEELANEYFEIEVV